jgi:hypothetical protein
MGSFMAIKVESTSDAVVQLSRSKLFSETALTHQSKPQLLPGFESSFEFRISKIRGSEGLMTTSLYFFCGCSEHEGAYRGGGIVVSLTNFSGSTQWTIAIRRSFPTGSSTFESATVAEAALTTMVYDRWNALEIIYTKGPVLTWVAKYDGVPIVSYSAWDYLQWAESSAKLWGVGCQSGTVHSTPSKSADVFIRRLQLNVHHLPTSPSMLKECSKAHFFPFDANTLNCGSTVEDNTEVSSAQHGKEGNNKSVGIDVSPETMESLQGKEYRVSSSQSNCIIEQRQVDSQKISYLSMLTGPGTDVCAGAVYRDPMEVMVLRILLGGYMGPVTDTILPGLLTRLFDGVDVPVDAEEEENCAHDNGNNSQQAIQRVLDELKDLQCTATSTSTYGDWGAWSGYTGGKNGHWFDGVPVNLKQKQAGNYFNSGTTTDGSQLRNPDDLYMSNPRGDSAGGSGFFLAGFSLGMLFGSSGDGGDGGGGGFRFGGGLFDDGGLFDFGDMFDGDGGDGE